MMNGLFVTGTDTNVGKTVLSAAMLHRYRATARLTYWKPVQTGAPEDDDTEVVRQLGACGDEEICATGIRLPRPLSPHRAAELCGQRIDMDAILRQARLADKERVWLVEGAGGILVPLNWKDLMIDLIASLGIPALIVARSGLGTINHTLLTIEALWARSIPVAGVVLNGEPNPSNRDAIEAFGDVAVLGELPVLSDLAADPLGRWARAELDVESHLEPIFARCSR